MRGETSTLSVGLDTLMRVTSNPFFPWMMVRIDHHIACSEQADVAACLRPESVASEERQVHHGADGDPGDSAGGGEAEQAHEARADAQKDTDTREVKRLY